jgi:hypothetical protein
MMGIVQKINERAMNEEVFLGMPLYLVYLYDSPTYNQRKDSPEYMQRKGMVMPAGSF